MRGAWSAPRFCSRFRPRKVSSGVRRSLSVEAHLRVGANLFETVPVDPASQVAPERVPDHATQPRDRVLVQARLVEDNLLLAVVLSERELLQQI